eukprot:g5225.t1
MATGSDDPCIKLILLGNGSVGKTSMIARFISDGFSRVYNQTVGLDWFEKKVQIKSSRVKLQVWDIGGQSVSSKMLGKYVFGSDVIFLCYDITDSKSFADVEDWLQLARKTPSNVASPKFFLVGNKIDMEHLRKIPEEKHDRFIEENGLEGGFFASAQSGDKVQLMFYEAAAKQLGVQLGAYEREMLAKPLAVSVVSSSASLMGGQDGRDEHRLEGADQIEEEDLQGGRTWTDMLDEADAKRSSKKKKMGMCCMC